MVEKLRELGDVRALPALRGLRGRRLGPLRFGGADTGCMKAGARRGDREPRRKGEQATSRKARSRHARRGRGRRPMEAMRYDPKNLLTSLVLVFPLFLIYQIGVLFTLPMLNGADFLTVFLFRNLGLSSSALPGATPSRSRWRSPSRWRCSGASSGSIRS